jgi:TolB-like protein/DNA-binding winged helix-turn-helix (wHTH) protein
VDAPGLDGLEFGGFRLDRRRRRLIDPNGTPLRVTAKAFDTLVYFLEHPGRVIDRSTLLDALWPDTIVEENNLSQAIAALRRVLGPGFIVTITGRGYQFVADVHDVAMPIARPRRRWRYAAAVLVGLSTLAPRAAVDVRTNTLAVLPLVSLSGDKDDELFADGLTEELIHRLARITALQVTARTSSFQFKKSTADAKDIARALGVRHLLEGSVARDANRLRVRVRLIDATNRRTVWSESFDRGVRDTLAIQDEIGRSTVTALLGPLGVNERLAATGATTNAEAYELYLASKGNGRLTPDDVALGLDRITRALALDPEFALGWAQKSRLLNHSQVLRGRATGDAQAAAEHAAMRAITLEPNLGAAHSALAASLMTRKDRLRAEAEFERGIALGYWDDADMYGLFLLSVGRLRHALEHLMIVRARDPLNANAAAWIAAAYDGLGNTDAALSELERGRRLFDRWQQGLSIETLIRLGAGRRQEVRLVPRLYPQLMPLWQPYLTLFESVDDPAKAMGELRTHYDRPGAFQGHLLAFAARLGEPELAVDRFLQLVESGDGTGSAAGILWAHVFRDMRRLPQFKEVVRAEHLVEYWRRSKWPDLCRSVGDDFECW